MCVITRYAERRLKDWSNQDEIRENNNSTSKLNDRSLRINLCGAERQRCENTGSNQIEKKGSLSEKNEEQKEYMSTPKIDKQMEGVFTPWRRQKKGKHQDMEGSTEQGELTP